LIEHFLSAWNRVVLIWIPHNLLQDLVITELALLVLHVLWQIHVELFLDGIQLIKHHVLLQAHIVKVFDILTVSLLDFLRLSLNLLNLTQRLYQGKLVLLQLIDGTIELFLILLHLVDPFLGHILKGSALECCLILALVYFECLSLFHLLAFLVQKCWVCLSLCSLFLPKNGRAWCYLCCWSLFNVIGLTWFGCRGAEYRSTQRRGFRCILIE
jgi:hypothetical protein